MADDDIKRVLRSDPRHKDSANDPETLPGQLGRVRGFAPCSFRHAGPWAWFAAAMWIFLIVGYVSCNSNTQQSPSTAVSPTPEEQPPSGKGQKAVTVARPTAPPPDFRVRRLKLDEGISVVVSPNTTDEQLRSLLWLFREKIRSHRFKDIGIMQPTWTHFEKAGYLSGEISIYRGEKCADEYFMDYQGPCRGPDPHEAAVYHWGLLVDGVFTPDADSGGVYTAKGQHFAEIFNYKDKWEPPSAPPTGKE